MSEVFASIMRGLEEMHEDIKNKNPELRRTTWIVSERNKSGLNEPELEAQAV